MEFFITYPPNKRSHNNVKVVLELRQGYRSRLLLCRCFTASTPTTCVADSWTGLLCIK